MSSAPGRPTKDGSGRREEGARQGEGGRRRGHIKRFSARENAVVPLHGVEKKRNDFFREGTSPSRTSGQLRDPSRWIRDAGSTSQPSG